MSDETRIPAPEDETPEERRIGELVRRHGSYYHDPPATPREAIWARIEAERGKAGGVVPLAPRTQRRWWLGALAMAAVLALGIALGRVSMREASEREGPAGAPVATRGTPAPREPETGARLEPGAEPGAESAAAEQLAAADPATVAAPGETRGEDAAPPAAVAPRVSAQRPGPELPAADRAAPASAAPRDLYRLASQQMLGQAEALLAHYRADRAAERIDPAVGRWARDVLTSTRLLLDSPASDDPEMRSLLQDLELVLAQIVQRTGQPDPLEDEMIDRTIEDRDLLPRLRGAVPAGVGSI
jgi:hypothetical protein